MSERTLSARAGLCGVLMLVDSAARMVLCCRRPLLVMVYLLMPAVARAQVVSGGTDPATILTNIATFILGPFGESLAVLAMIGVGFAFILGRASLGIIGSIVGGLVLIFGASYLVTTIVGAG